jgi:hypothetical protein
MSFYYKGTTHNVFEQCLICFYKLWKTISHIEIYNCALCSYPHNHKITIIKHKFLNAMLTTNMLDKHYYSQL